MSKVIRWKEIDGHTLQDLIADLLVAEGFGIENRGVGPDGGADLIATQNIRLHDEIFKTFRWVVQVKYKQRTNATVKPAELGNIANILSQFDSDGFLLVSNARVSVNTYSQIRAISTGKPPNYLVGVWDNRVLEGKLLQHESLIAKYFSRSDETKPILVVEDNAAVLKATQEILSAVGLKVLTARSAEGALRIVRSRRIGVAVVDVRLDQNQPQGSQEQGLDGIALADEIRQLQPEVKLIYYSAYLASADVKARVGIDNAIFLSKFDTPISELQEIVKRSIGVPKEISRRARQYESVATFVNSSLHGVVSNIHAAKSLAENSPDETQIADIVSLLATSLAQLRGVMKDLTAEHFGASAKDFEQVTVSHFVKSAVDDCLIRHPGSRILMEPELLKTGRRLTCDPDGLRLALSQGVRCQALHGKLRRVRIAGLLS
ncbi:MAG: response regulator [Acidobacteriota bacterium]